MRCHKGKSYQRILWCAGWWDNGVDEHTVVKGQLGNHKGLLDVSYIERYDRTFGISDFKAFFLEALQSIVGHIPKVLQTRGLLLKDVQSLESSSGSGGSVAGTEDISTAAVAQEIDGVCIAGNEAANRSKALRECTHDEVYLVGQTEVVADSASLLAEYAKAVCLVYHERTVVFMLEFNDFGQLGQITFHREDAIDYDELDGLFGQFLKHALQVFHVIVLVVELSGK